METRKLISLKDYVLNHNPTKEQTTSYAKFLSMPLELGFFVPANEEGNVLEEPEELKIKTGVFHPNHVVKINGKDKTLCSYKDEYQQAKERVLFKGFVIDKPKSEIVSVFRKQPDRKMFFGTYNLKMKKFVLAGAEEKTIESLVNLGLELTESAQKRLGL